MKRFVSFIMMMVLVCSTINLPALAADKISPEQITNFTFDYVKGIGLDSCRLLNGRPHINLETAALKICSESKYSAKTQTLTFTYGGHSGSVTIGSKTAYLDGKPVELTHAPAAYGSTIWGTIECITKLFDRKATLATTVADRKYADFGNNVQAGDKIYYYNITYNQGSANYTQAQLVFMQGLAAPIVLHNIHQGLPAKRDDFSDAELSRHVYLLRPLSGVYNVAMFREGFKDTLRVGWGITSRTELVTAIQFLIQEARDTDKSWAAYNNSRAVQLAQTGYLVGWLTAEETITYGMQAARQAQREFTSWSDYATYYMKGARMVIPEAGIQGAEARQKYVDFLYKGNVFQNVSWNIDLTAAKGTE